VKKKLKQTLAEEMLQIRLGTCSDKPYLTLRCALISFNSAHQFLPQWRPESEPPILWQRKKGAQSEKSLKQVSNNVGPS
jgi:hypothetical protein